MVLVFACGFGWVAREVQQTRAQREAAKAIEKLGAQVVYGPASDGMIRTAVAWVGKLFGEDLSGDVTAVGLGGTQVSDAGLAHLQGLTQLRRLDLANTKVTGPGVDELNTALPNVHIER